MLSNPVSSEELCIAHKYHGIACSSIINKVYTLAINYLTAKMYIYANTNNFHSSLHNQNSQLFCCINRQIGNWKSSYLIELITVLSFLFTAKIIYVDENIFCWSIFVNVFASILGIATVINYYPDPRYVILVTWNLIFVGQKQKLINY